MYNMSFYQPIPSSVPISSNSHTINPPSIPFDYESYNKIMHSRYDSNNSLSTISREDIENDIKYLEDVILAIDNEEDCIMLQQTWMQKLRHRLSSL
jgi:hypothetical protein